MAKINLDPVPSGWASVEAFNERFAAVEAAIENTVSRDGAVPSHMKAPLDMNSNPIINYSADFTDSTSLITVGEADSRYVFRAGDQMTGALHVLLPTEGTEPARKDQLDATINNYQAADANLQEQISGAEPLEASAFSEISWHDQVVSNSVTIPENKNAWSFGPVMSIAAGQAVTIGDGSFWTIAEGELQ